jgi:hypothetical protein
MTRYNVNETEWDVTTPLVAKALHYMGYQSVYDAHDIMGNQEIPVDTQASAALWYPAWPMSPQEQVE